MRATNLLAAVAVLSLALATTIDSRATATAMDRDAQPAASAAVTVTYQASTENFPNPERGFYRQRAPFYIGTQRYPLTAALRQFRSEGIALLRAYYVIDEFTQTTLPQSFLDAMTADFAGIRAAGLKIIPRVAYSFPCADPNQPCDPSTFGPTDAPIDRVLGHIDQLAPVLQGNADVVAFMEMGFVGAWGEWHSSTNNLVTNPRTVNANSAAIVARLLSALPVRRMTALRYPYQKQSLYGASPLTAPEAFTGAAKARVGAHNDCFLSDYYDSGTYDDPAAPGLGPEVYKQFLSADNRYVPQGGETCTSGPAAQPYIPCANALTDLARMRWSTINTEYHPSVIALWQQEGCYPEIARRLGYRFRLVTAQLPTRATVGDTLHVTLNVANDGWAPPYNARLVELVLRNTATGQRYMLPVTTDPRFWGPGETTVVNADLPLPAGIPPGTYALLLHMPDPEPTLRNLADYSIRLANVGVWEAPTGYNDLQVSLVVDPPPPPPPGAFAKVSPAHGATGQATSLTLTWTASSDAASYRYCVDTLNNNVCDTAWVSAGANLSAPVGPLAHATAYYWQVQALNATATTDASGGAWWEFTTAAAPPPLPAAFAKLGPAHGAAGQPTSPSLTWAASSGAASYRYCVDTIDNNACDTGWTSAGASLGVTLGPLAAATSYYWQVEAQNGTGATPANGGTWWTFTTRTLPPTSLDDAFATGVNVPLVVPAPGVLSNDNGNGGGAMSAALVNQAAHGIVALAAHGGFDYTPQPGFQGTDSFTYAASTASGAGNVATVTITVSPNTVPQPPTQLYTASLAGNVVTLRWNVPATGPLPTGYVVEGGLSSGEVLASLPTGNTFPIFTFVSPSATIYVRVRSVAGGHVSAASNEIRVSVNVPEPPSAPGPLLGLADGSALALVWRNTFAGGEPTSLVLDVSGAVTASLPLALSDTFVYAGMPPGSYTFTLRAVNAAGSSVSSNAVTLAFPAPCAGPPLTPVNFLAYSSGSTITAMWDPPATGPAPTGYVIHVGGTFTGSFPTSARTISGVVGPGPYVISVSASNACGSSAPTLSQSLSIP